MSTTHQMIVPPPSKVGTNRKPGRCSYCGLPVAAGEGELLRGASGWMVNHRRLPEDCELKGYIRVQDR
jgi:hypothetical protein